jgi:predicted deacylase
LENYRVIHADHAGHADYLAPLGQVVPKGTRLVQTLQFGATPRWQETVAAERCIPVLHHSSAVVHEGAELMKVFTRFRRV